MFNLQPALLQDVVSLRENTAQNIPPLQLTRRKINIIQRVFRPKNGIAMTPLKPALALFALMGAMLNVAHAQMSFTSAEHLSLGDSVHFSLIEPSATPHRFTLPNGEQLTYGEMVAMADLYEIPGAPLATAPDEPTKRNRFLDAFNSFTLKPTVHDELTAIVKLFHFEKNTIDAAIAAGQAPEEALKNVFPDLDRQFNCITGGGCLASNWWMFPGRYLKLAEQDYDHFGADALLAYQVGHRLALEQAVNAKKTGDLSRLTVAYAMNAFASHFLSDRFASGHLRTPRKLLNDHVTPTEAGALLANYMHNEENANGLHVHNAAGDQWLAIGDRSCLNPKNAAHKKMVERALQRSVDELEAAYSQGSSEIPDSVAPLIPWVDEENNHVKGDISPLFYWDAASKTLYRRKEIGNLHDAHWIKNWWGWSTLIELRKHYGLTMPQQARLARSKIAKQALDAGLITHPAILNAMNKGI